MRHAQEKSVSDLVMIDKLLEQSAHVISLNLCLCQCKIECVRVINYELTKIANSATYPVSNFLP